MLLVGLALVIPVGTWFGLAGAGWWRRRPRLTTWVGGMPRRDGNSRWAQSRPVPRPDARVAESPAVPPAAPVAPGPPEARPAVPMTRTSRAWMTLIGGSVALAVVLIFILQNLKSTRVSFLFVHWKLPLAIDLLLAALLGGGVVLTAGSLRILQLRRLARRNPRRGPD